MNQNQQASSVTPLPSAISSEIKTWNIKKPVKSKKGALMSYIERQGVWGRIQFQTTAHHSEQDPKCVAPFGISKPYDESKQADPKRNLELTIHSPSLFNFLVELDQWVEDTVTPHYDEWINAPADDGKKKKAKAAVPLTEAEIRRMHKPLVRREDDQYKPQFRTKVYVDGANPVNVYLYGTDASGRPTLTKGTPNDITKFCELVAVVELASIWYMNQQFGLSLQTTDVMVFPQAKKQSGMFNFGDMGAPPALLSSSSDPQSQSQAPAPMAVDSEADGGGGDDDSESGDQASQGGATGGGGDNDESNASVAPMQIVLKD
jgi:hypothetical protein